MAKKNARNTKGRIITAAWKLFYEQGYDNTTIEEIVETSGTSKGSFYHYFEGKDALLSSLSYLFDEKYEELIAAMDPAMNRADALVYFNHELFFMIENSISMDLLARMFSSQLITKGEKHLLDHNRVYYRCISRLVSEGQARGELIQTVPSSEIVKAYALMERAIMYDWCICNGEYSLTRYAEQLIPQFLQSYRK